MKKKRNIIMGTLFAVVLLLLTTGCDLIGSNDTGTAPTIQDAGFFPENQYDVLRVTTLIADGRNYDLLAQIEDPDLDADVFTIREVDPDGIENTLESDLASQPAALSQYILYRGQVTGPYGLYRIYLKVKDKEGNWSNEFQINVFISAP